MAAIHLMVGFMGFGKTTVAKQLEKSIPAVCLTHDEFMVKLFGRNMPYGEFHAAYQKVDDMLWDMAEKIIHSDTDVIMDYGFWSHEDRKNAFNRAKKITKDVLFHNVYCDISVAKERILKRSQDNPNELFIREDEFDALVEKYQPWSNDDKYPVCFHYCQNGDIYTSAAEPRMTKMHFGVYGGIVKDGKMLVIKKARGPYTGLYDLPGGSQEKGESFVETLKREIEEETGLSVVKFGNEQFQSIIFADFTPASGEKGILQHNAILYDVDVTGEMNLVGDGRDSNGAVWVDISSLTSKNATPLVLKKLGKIS